MDEITLKGADISMPDLEIEQEKPIKKSRGRGRPRKVDVVEEEIVEDARVVHPTPVEDVQIVPNTPDNPLNRVRTIRKINQYKQLFSSDLKGIRLGNLDNLDEEQLNDKLKQVQQAVESRKSVNSSRAVFLVGLSSLEKVDYMAGLQLQGLTNCAAQSEELMLTVDEVAIKYFDHMVSSDPIVRLCIGLGHLALAVDSANRAKITNNTSNNTTGSSNTTNESNTRNNNLFTEEFSAL